MNPRRATTICCVVFLITHVSAAAQTTVVRSAHVTTDSSPADLQSKFREILTRQTGLAWIGYEVPSIRGCRMFCGHSGEHDCVCSLENESESYTQTLSSDSGVAAESSEMFVLYRVKDHRIRRIRCYSSGCRLDAGNQPFYLISDVRSAESISLLKSLIDSSDRRARDDGDFIGNAIMAIAVHSDPGAFTTLEELVSADRTEEVRKQAVFWLGQRSDSPGVEILDRVLRTDKSEDVRNQAVFALSCSDAPSALDVLIRTAHADTDPDIRGTALFWLANKADTKSAEAIVDAVENDPDAGVKEKAIFALSQLPAERGVPLLIEIARANRSPKVREQAIFWLGQSDDPLALDFFEEVLTH